MRLESLAMRWHVARMERLELQRQIKSAADPYCCRHLELQRADAKRLETRALRELAKECAKSRASLKSVEAGGIRPRLPATDVIDI